MKKIGQKWRKLIKIVKIPRLVQLSGKNTQIPRRKPKYPDLVKKPSAGNTGFKPRSGSSDTINIWSH